MCKVIYTIALTGMMSAQLFALEAGNGKTIETKDVRIATFQMGCWDAGAKAVSGPGVEIIIKTGFETAKNRYCEGNLVYYKPQEITEEQLVGRMKKGCHAAKLRKTDMKTPDGIRALTLNTPWITEGDCLQFLLVIAEGRNFSLSVKDLPETWILDASTDGVLKGLTGECLINIQSDRSARPKQVDKQQRKASLTLVLTDTQNNEQTEIVVPFMVAKFRGAKIPKTGGVHRH